MTLARHSRRMLTDQLERRGIVASSVLSAIDGTPRHLFVEPALADRAYEDRALPIGERQTISQPYIVALMTQALELTGSERVLEIGTGSGYQAAVLSRLADRVYSVERVKVLADRARATLDRLKIYNVVVRVLDGTFGLPAEAPFDAVIVTAGAPSVPPPLIDQLRENGRLVAPIGSRDVQYLHLLTKRRGAVHTTVLTECSFVPLLGTHAWAPDSTRVPLSPSLPSNGVR